MNVLFLCVANSARSQMAEGLAKAIFGKKLKAMSAGSMPSGKVQPWAIAALKEDGIDISKNFSKSYQSLPAKEVIGLDYVITLCAEEICPRGVFAKAKMLAWPVQDPASAPENEKVDAFRSARDQIREKLLQFGREHDLI